MWAGRGSLQDQGMQLSACILVATGVITRTWQDDFREMWKEQMSFHSSTRVSTARVGQEPSIDHSPFVCDQASDVPICVLYQPC
jgi:hypothetical protein